MNLKIISWYVRGLNDWDKKLPVRNLLKLWREDFVELVGLARWGTCVGGRDFNMIRL